MLTQAQVTVTSAVINTVAKIPFPGDCFGLRFLRAKSPWWLGQWDNREQAWWPEQDALRAHSLNVKHQVKRRTGNGSPNSPPGGVLLNKVTSPNPLWTATPTGGQVFKYTSLWETSSFKPPQAHHLTGLCHLYAWIWRWCLPKTSGSLNTVDAWVRVMWKCVGCVCLGSWGTRLQNAEEVKES